ncbi:MAG: C1 family peptidase [Bacteroidetes bacterium]|nr:C1 family peptidase [Bacteroidota bacterium]
MIFKVSRYGWQPDLPDQRDFRFAASPAVLSELPGKTDLRPGCPPVYDQGELGSCTANAIGAAFEFGLIKQDAPAFMPSRLFIYYNERVIEHSVSNDSGAMIRDGIKTVKKEGVCPEKDWPYIISRFALKPGPACYSTALEHQVLSYHRVPRILDQIKGCLAEGFPMIFGFTVYESFESAAVAGTGIVELPAPGEHVVGGHAVLAVGYDNTNRRFLVRNSWSDQWGMKGYFTMPYTYLLNENLSDDFWTIRLIEENQAINMK